MAGTAFHWSPDIISPAFRIPLAVDDQRETSVSREMFVSILLVTQKIGRSLEETAIIVVEGIAGELDEEGEVLQSAPILLAVMHPAHGITAPARQSTINRARGMAPGVAPIYGALTSSYCNISA